MDINKQGIIFNPLETEEMKYLKSAIQILQDDVTELKDEVFLLKEWRGKVLDLSYQDMTKISSYYKKRRKHSKGRKK